VEGGKVFSRARRRPAAGLGRQRLSMQRGPRSIASVTLNQPLVVGNILSGDRRNRGCGRGASKTDHAQQKYEAARPVRGGKLIGRIAPSATKLKRENGSTSPTTTGGGAVATQALRREDPRCRARGPFLQQLRNAYRPTRSKATAVIASPRQAPRRQYQDRRRDRPRR
jgi:hypothetical protein